MPPQELERTAHTVECFLNALRLDDGRARTEIEEWLVKWLSNEANRDAYAIFHHGEIRCHQQRRIVHNFPLPDVTQLRTIWCDRKKLSIIDGEAYANGGKLIMLGTAGLTLTLPGTAAGQPNKKERNSNNNNNNNNNNG